MHSQVSKDEIELSASLLILEMFLKFLIEDRMKENLLPVKSLLLISLQTTHDKIFHIVTDL